MEESICTAHKRELKALNIAVLCEQIFDSPLRLEFGNATTLEDPINSYVKVFSIFDMPRCRLCNGSYVNISYIFMGIKCGYSYMMSSKKDGFGDRDHCFNISIDCSVPDILLSCFSFWALVFVAPNLDCISILILNVSL